MGILKERKVMKIKMKKTTRGSEDGHTVKEFLKNKSYTVVEDLGKVFVEQLKVATVAKIKSDEQLAREAEEKKAAEEAAGGEGGEETAGPDKTQDVKDTDIDTPEKKKKNKGKGKGKGKGKSKRTK